MSGNVLHDSFIGNRFSCSDVADEVSTLFHLSVVRCFRHQYR